MGWLHAKVSLKFFFDEVVVRNNEGLAGLRGWVGYRD